MSSTLFRQPQQAFNALSSRDQQLLKVLMVFLLVLLPVLAVWSVHQQAKKSSVLLQQEKDTLSYMIANVNRIDYSSQNEQPLATEVQALAQQVGLTLLATPMSDTQFQLTTKNGSYAVLANFLTQIALKNIDVRSFNFTQQQGELQLQLELVRE